MADMCWRLRALDTLFFRDGTPYDAGEGTQMGVAGTFPPSIHTLQGAIRTLLARERGWREDGGGAGWPAELGDADSPGQLSFQGPYLRRGEDWLFPAPALVLQPARKDAPYLRLVPAKTPVWTDLGPVRLPRPRAATPGARGVSGCWVTAAGLAAVLAGGVPAPDQVFRPADLWREEPRTGIQRQEETRTVGEGQLYSAVHIRLYECVELAVLVSGLPVDWHPRSPAMLRLGGEGRLAAVQVGTERVPLPDPPTLPAVGGKVRFTVTLLTPGRYGEADRTAAVLRRGPPGVPGEVVSACIGRLERVGGWDLRRRQPRPVAPVVPAGTTWFYVTEPERREAVLGLHGQRLGDWAAYGYGQVVIGRWEESV